jgi:hypothetical protein
MRTLVLDIERPCIDHGYKGNGQGYASVRRPTGRDPKVLLHRWLFGQAHGYLPEAVMHRCDNTRCIEVAHLIGGTRADNNKDRAAKGRSAKVRHDKRKLTPGQVAEIRVRYTGKGRGKDPVNGVTALAREFGVDSNVIYQITSGRTYRCEF